MLQVIGAIFTIIGAGFLSFTALCFVAFMLTTFGWWGAVWCIVAAFFLGWLLHYSDILPF